MPFDRDDPVRLPELISSVTDEVFPYAFKAVASSQNFGVSLSPPLPFFATGSSFSRAATNDVANIVPDIPISNATDGLNNDVFVPTSSPALPSNGVSDTTVPTQDGVSPQVVHDVVEETGVGSSSALHEEPESANEESVDDQLTGNTCLPPGVSSNRNGMVTRSKVESNRQ
ncbi:hypothetical protein V6N11_080548 [Hibiscus sabdariffa]|uniref:Uncharacterized protein n=1 Tax=Hibiscus sabdariffa TaxID=183260 RepID=A0ABR2R7Z0_9ROSI